MPSNIDQHRRFSPKRVSSDGAKNERSLLGSIVRYVHMHGVTPNSLRRGIRGIAIETSVEAMEALIKVFRDYGQKKERAWRIATPQLHFRPRWARGG